MLAKVHAAAIVGLEGEIVEVEVDTSRGLPSFTIVGLPDTAVQESRERVRAAVKNAGLIFPRQRVTVNFAPADLRKEGPASESSRYLWGSCLIILDLFVQFTTIQEIHFPSSLIRNPCQDRKVQHDG